MAMAEKVYLRGLASQESIGFDSGESISDYIVHTMYMTDGRSKLRNVVKMTGLSW